MVRRDGVRSLVKSAGPSSVDATSPAIRVALVSDSALFRSGLRSLLETDPVVTLVGEASALPARELMRTGAPHVLLVDAGVVGALPACAGRRPCGAAPHSRSGC